MRKIEKGTLAVLEKWKRANKGKKYADLVGHDDLKDAIRHTCVIEQHGLCAYCCCRITVEKGSACNEHIEAQHLARTARWTSTILLRVAPRPDGVTMPMVVSLYRLHR
ncbi:Uncharacterized protein ALO46_04132 [Pseudomonas syringae pv. solidagae]|uniref:Uncharacterized protein n=1 Tax=Pseudomonas syringae pv. solidagae TaxID=264458 RepID=A0A0N8STG5_PSESX|nr:Uncharacterized protein ALO46_04132 [Pseudomonas syringae pv. solidagae]RMT38875.1 hypothetical protein ALP48_01680 [Pseudomonas syringae pv. solidagae]